MSEAALFTVRTCADLSVFDKALQARKSAPTAELVAQIETIFQDVSARGAYAIVDHSKARDHEAFGGHSIIISDDVVKAAVADLDPALSSAIDMALENITRVNGRIVAECAPWHEEVAPGHVVGELAFPLETALLWVPARKAPLISTALMLCAAARSAGVKRIVLATPPTKTGAPDLNTIAAAKKAGATDFVCGNGVATIAAAATGNWELGKMDAIFGPGPIAISVAMASAARYGVATQSGVGPSDSLVVFDDGQNPAALAGNILTEIEHGPDSYSYGLTTSQTASEAVASELNKILSQLGTKARHYTDLLMRGQVGVICFANDAAMTDFANDFAAEHLLLACAPERQDALSQVLIAGEVLKGLSTPFAAANYCIGITAVLPTNRFARAYSGITARNFLRFTSVACLSPEALGALLPTIRALGRFERLPLHVEAAEMTFQGANDAPV